MILHGNHNLKIPKQKTIPTVSDEKFLFNHFGSTEKNIFYQLTLPFLDMDDSVNFYKSCQKYAKLYDHSENGLLFLWKYLYHRDFGSIKFQKKRRAKQTRQKQMEKHQERLKDHNYWKEQYELRAMNKHFIFCQSYKLTFFRYTSYLRYVDENDMIIVCPNKCKARDLLKLENFIWSNWYDIDDDNLWRYRNYHNYRVHRKLINGKDGRFGFEGLDIDVMMENMYISKRGIRGYVYLTRYKSLKCALIEILSLKSNHDINNKEDKEFRKCTLFWEKEYGGNGELIEGLILNRILSAQELQCKMLEKAQFQKKLTVMVYVMAFGLNGNFESFDERPFDFATKAVHLKCVVVDFYGDLN